MAKYSNLLFGLKVLASDKDSFGGLNEKGYKLVSLMNQFKGDNLNKLPKKSDFEEIGASGVITNIEKLWDSMVVYNGSVSATKKERKSALERIISLEYTICSSLGLTLRTTEDSIEYTETITVNQYEFFENCFSYRTKKGKEESQELSNGVVITDNGTVTMDCTTVSTFKKNVLFGLVNACANDGTIYSDETQKKARVSLAKKHDTEDKKLAKAKAESEEKAKVEDYCEKIKALGLDEETTKMILSKLA